LTHTNRPALAGDNKEGVMPEPRRDKSLLKLWRAGDEAAARQLFERYVDRLVALARTRLSHRFAGRVDPEDVVQSVFRTFFNRAKAGQFHIQDTDDLCKLLVRITIHKTLRQVAFHKAAKRNLTLEQGQSHLSHDQLRELLSPEPTPEDANAFLDQLEHFLAKQRPQDRQIIEMRMQGYTDVEIAAKLNITDRSIRRVMERIRGLAAQDGLAP
jgi:RNA polymerase sigma-70 factor (ECF subfamily)